MSDRYSVIVQTRYHSVTEPMGLRLSLKFSKTKRPCYKTVFKHSNSHLFCQKKFRKKLNLTVRRNIEKTKRHRKCQNIVIKTKSFKKIILFEKITSRACLDSCEILILRFPSFWCETWSSNLDSEELGSFFHNIVVLLPV